MSRSRGLVYLSCPGKAARLAANKGHKEELSAPIMDPSIAYTRLLLPV